MKKKNTPGRKTITNDGSQSFISGQDCFSGVLRFSLAIRDACYLEEVAIEGFLNVIHVG